MRLILSPLVFAKDDENAKRKLCISRRPAQFNQYGHFFDAALALASDSLVGLGRAGVFIDALAVLV